MEPIENPVIERQIQWMNKMMSISFINFLKDKPKPFLEAAMIISYQDKSTPKKVWYDYVDGIIGLFSRAEFPSLKISLDEIETLTSSGFKEIIKYLERPSFQKKVIKKHQFSTDIISLSNQVQTVVDANSLANFRNSTNRFLLTESDVIELRNEFINKVKSNDGFSDKSIKKFREAKLTASQAGFALYFLMGKHPSFKKCTNRQPDLMKENLKALGCSTLSPNTVYLKGVVLLRNTEKYKDQINPTDFKVVIPILEKLDPEIAKNARNELMYLLLGDGYQD